jgi:hypothetical protein
MAELELTVEEKEHLATYNKRLRHIRDAVRGVVKQFHCGLFLSGEGGTGKSWTVLRQLKRLQANFVLHNSRMTGRGLVDTLNERPSDILVIEDAETLMDDPKAVSVLKSALWSQSTRKPPERIVTWKAYKTNIKVVFTGAIIVISNRDLGESQPEFRALKRRIAFLKLDVSNQELKAKMKMICQKGYEYGEDRLTPDECWEVAKFIISRLESLDRNLDLGLLILGFKDRLQWKAGDAKLHWHVLLEGRMKERVVYRTPAEQWAEEARIAREIHKKPWNREKKVRVWAKRTGRSHTHTGNQQPAYYRALRKRR